MKQAKISYEKYKEKLPKRPPNEIDFGLGFQAAIKWILMELELEESFEIFHARIKRELP